MMSMDGSDRKRTNRLDVVILLSILIVVAIVVLVVTLNWGTWNPQRENWDGATPQDPPVNPNETNR